MMGTVIHDAEPLPDTPPEPKPITPTKKSQKVIDAANEAAERLEKANAKADEILTRREELAVENSIAGETEAGQSKPQEETDAEYAKRVMSGEK